MAQNRKSTQTTQYARLRDMLISARREAGLTQAQVAVSLRKPQSYVSKIESGERRIDLVELLEFLRVVGADEVGFIKALRIRSAR